MQSNLSLTTKLRATHPLPEPPQTPGHSQFQLQISPKMGQEEGKGIEIGMNRLLHDQPLKKITAFLKKNRGRNFPVKYDASYNFMEKWQSTHKEASSQILIQQLCGMSPWVNLSMLPILLIQIWLLSIFRVFEYKDCDYIFILGLIKQIASIIFTCAGLYITVDRKIDFVSQLGKALSGSGEFTILSTIYCVVYDVLMIVDVGNIRTSMYLLPFDVLIIVFHYMAAEKIYSKIRIKAIGSKHKHVMHLFDLGSNILILIHIFSVLLFLCTYYSPDTNWLTVTPFQIKSGWVFHYTYSFYFTCTTMLTVGYGDFHPTNQVEILCILLVQIVGIVSNGYAISQIGANLTRLRSSRETLESDLSNAQKLAKFNAMEGDLQERLCEELVSNQQVNEELSLKEEEGILAKLNDELRQQICVTNQINIVKTSLFVLANFSKRMQIQMSKRMIKVIYPPNTTLLQVCGKEKLFVLAKGTLEIVTEKRWKNRTFSEKALRVMEKHTNDTNEVYRNVYGYAAMLSGRPSRLKAVSKSFAVCYTLQHQDILDFIVGSHDDFERYHAMKVKYHLTTLPEKLEVPGILSSREHYAPNILLLIRTYMKSLNKESKRNRKYNRTLLRTRIIVAKFQDENKERSNTFMDESESMVDEDNGIAVTPEFLQNFTKKLQSASTEHIMINKSRMFGRDKNNARYQELRNKNLNEKFMAQRKDEVYTESIREYKRYLPNGNVSAILAKNHKGKMIEGNPDPKSLSMLQTLRKKQLSAQFHKVRD